MKDLLLPITRLLTPTEFRLPHPDREAIYSLIGEMIAALGNQIAVEPIEMGRISAEDAVDLGKNLFDISAMLVGLEDDTDSPFLDTIRIRLEKLKDLFTKIDIEIIDHTGERWFRTMSVHVDIAEASPDVDDIVIAETIEPSIYFRGKLIHWGRVIVHKPAE